MKKKIIITTIFISLFLISAADSLNCIIKFSNEHIYHIGNDININFEIKNNNKENVFLEIADDISYNFDFIIYTEQGDQVNYSKDFLIQKKTKDKIFTKSILLSPNQSFSVMINISNWFNFENAGTYFIQGIFYPSLEKNNRIQSENILKLELNPQVDKESDSQNFLVKRKTNLEHYKDIPPYTVIEMYLKARQERDWDTYFSFYDFDKIIPQYQKYKNRYRYASEKERLSIIENFKNEQINKFYNDLVSFNIQKTVIEKGKATVYVNEEFKYKNYFERFSSEYYLELQNQVWLIVGYNFTPIK